jgi:hypothetical protein
MLLPGIVGQRVKISGYVLAPLSDNL